MKIGLKIFIIVFVLLAINALVIGCMNDINPETGSFVFDKTYSSDNKYYAVCNAPESRAISDKVSMVEVAVYSAENDELVSRFETVRRWDFWGICWERDSYNIWVQSGDIGIVCYKYSDGEWSLDKSAKLPDYIKTKYDKYFRTTQLSQ